MRKGPQSHSLRTVDLHWIRAKPDADSEKVSSLPNLNFEIRDATTQPRYTVDC